MLTALTCRESCTSGRPSGRSSVVEHDLSKVGVEGSNPFARSRHQQQSEKPSENRRGWKHRRLYPQKLLHSGRSTVELSVCDDGENSDVDYYSPLPRKLPKGVCLQGSIYHVRRRVPNALKTVIGRSELWRSLRTDSVQIAVRRMHFAAAEIEVELDAARSVLGLLCDPYASRLSERSAGQLALTILVEKVAARLALDSVNCGPMTPESDRTAKTLGEVYDLYTADPKHTWCERTRIAYRTTRKWVMEYFGEHTLIGEITREQARGFVQMLLQVPRHADRKFPNLTIVQAVEAAKQRPDAKVISIANVNAYLNKFSGVINWAVEEGYLAKSPAKGLRLRDPVKKRDKRRPFSTEQLQRIFHSPLYTGCIDDVYGYAKVGDAKPRRARFWIPLIALFSGMRMNEICQLQVADIRIFDGVECFVVIEGGDKHVKTAASERAIPIHQELIRMDFLAFVENQRSTGQTDLFHELSRGPYGYRSTNFSKWFSRFLVKIEASAPLTCFHSFRHCFRDALRSGKVDRDASLALGGWTSDKGSAGIDEIYGDGCRALMLREAINCVSFPQLRLSHLTGNSSLKFD